MVEPVTIGNIRGVVSTTAVVEALPGSEFLAVASEPGRVVEVSKKAGDQVKAGELLVRLEFPAAREEGTARVVSVKNAEARLQAAKTMQTRVHKLRDQGAASQLEVDGADQEVINAEDEVALSHSAQDAANTSGQHTIIRAPFNGIVAERLHNPGDSVGTSAADAVLRIIDPRQVEVSAAVAVSDATRFAAGVSARGVTETKAKPEILRVISRPLPEAGATTVPVRLAFVEATELAPGAQLGVEIDAEQHLNVPLVPAIAVMKDNNEQAIFVAAGNQARRRPVVVGLIDAEYAEIRSGVKAGELVVTQGQTNLHDGSEITISQ